MNDLVLERNIEVFSTCPSSGNADRKAYLPRVIDVARRSEQAGCRGIYVCPGNSQLDPWLLAHVIVQQTELLCPVIGVQPAYMHPYAVAKAVATIAHLYRRRVYLNMVAGGLRNDLTALSDGASHDERYLRLVEYALIVKRLLAGGKPVSFDGAFYRVERLKLAPSLPAELVPEIFVSGSSKAGLAAAEAIGATAIRYPWPLNGSGDGQGATGERPAGIRVGIVSRPRDEEAWAIAHAQFPVAGWPAEGSPATRPAVNDPYWLAPLEHYQTLCPYLVGGYDRVGREIARYVSHGYRTFILDVPHSADELTHIRQVFDRAEEASLWQNSSTTG